MFDCGQCSRSYRRQSQLVVHLRQHTGERPFSCECGKNYAREDHLRRHQRSCPGDKVPPSVTGELQQTSPHRKLYSCPQCGAGPFRQKKMVWAHVAMVHRERKHVCEHCSKAFPTKSKLARHATRHHGFTCPHCENNSDGLDPVIFNNFVGLRRHIASVHPKPALTCSVCGKHFDRPSRLKEHELTHTPGGPELRRQYVCTLCPHILPSVSKEASSSLGEGSSEATIQVTAFTAKRNLHAHMRLVHADLVFPCTWPTCPVLLSTKQKLLQHLQRHEANRPVAQSSRNRRLNTQGEKIVTSKHKVKPVATLGRRSSHKLQTDEDETASQSSIVALLMDSGDELSAQ